MTDRPVLVVDAGTSGVRAALVRPDASIGASSYREVLPSTPAQGFVEFDATALRDAAIAVATQVLDESGADVAGVGITNQRASTVVWDRTTGEPVAPAIGWQDLRTVGMCLALQNEGIRLAPNASATKVALLLDMFDHGRERAGSGDLLFGTVDTWLAWCLSQGEVHATDLSNACVTGLVDLDASGWSARALEVLRIPPVMLPRLADSAAVLGAASALPGAPPLAGIAGDQQASLVGQGCVVPGAAKLTLGTGGMLDVCVGAERPSFEQRGDAGSLPLVAWRHGGALTWCAEAVMLTAGASVEWLRDGLGLIESAAESAGVAGSVSDAAGVMFVPALLGLGAPRWDFGARGTLVGLTRGTTRAHVVRAVLEGVAHRGVDLLQSAEADTGLRVERLRLDGGMAQNGVVVQALADFSGRPVEVSPVTEATTLGAAFHAGVAAGVWASLDETAKLFAPARVVEPAVSDAHRESVRERWADAVQRSAAWVPELSTLDF